MLEVFLHHVWKYSLFIKEDLKCTSGERIEIIDPGNLNSDSGPDFHTARLKIGDTLWVGCVEVHLNSSDWEKHGHDQDEAYENCILHVVLNADTNVKTKSGRVVHCLELKSRIHDSAFRNYRNLLENHHHLPCEPRLKETDPNQNEDWFHQLARARLEIRSRQIASVLEKFNGSWDQSYYFWMGKQFGFSLNAIPFTMLCDVLPLNLLHRHGNNLEKTEALLFGCAGFLEDESGDPYYMVLREHFLHYKNLLRLRSLHISSWKFLRMRPNNFPTVRIAQFAALYFDNNNLFSLLPEISSYTEAREVFNLKASSYWDEHYRFNCRASLSVKILGKRSADLLIINACLPFLYTWGKFHNSEMHINKAIEILGQIEPEQNHIISRWKKYGIKAGNALHSQALVELSNEFCSQKKCLNCGIGLQLINNLP